MNRALPKRFASGQRQQLGLLLCCAGVIAGSSSRTVSGQPADDTGAKPGVVRIVRGPGSQALEALENISMVMSKTMMGFADWASLNKRLTDQVEKLLYDRLTRQELEISPKDALGEVAIKTVLQNLPCKYARAGNSTTVLFQRKRSMLRAGNRLMERDSAEHQRWLETQIKGLEDSEEVEVEEFLQGKSLELCISSEPESPPQTAVFTVTASLSPGRKWTGQGGWGAWGSIPLQEFKVSIKLPKDWERERLFRDNPFTPNVVSGFGVEAVDTMVWPPTPLREQYPLLELLAEDSDADCFAALQKAAQKGDAEAQFLLGRAYERGEGTAANLSLAAKWWEESAKHGFAPGLCAAGEACLRGIGRASDPKEGLRYLEKAAGLGNARAMALLGAQEMMSNTNQPGTRGLARIQKAAAAGDPAGLDLMSTAYATGTGVPKDQARAEQLQLAAAAAGNPAAMLNLGRQCLVQRKAKEGWPWLYLAAKYNTTLLATDYGPIKEKAIGDILHLRQMLSATDLEAAERDGRALEKLYWPIWTRK